MSKTIFLDVQVPVYFEVAIFSQLFFLQISAGGIQQPNGNREPGRDSRLQRLWRSTDLDRLAQGGAWWKLVQP